MKTKVLLAALVGAVAAFLLGWVVYGMLLEDYYKANSTEYAGLMKTEEEMQIWAIFLFNLAWTSMFAWAFDKMPGTTNFGAGFVAGAILSVLIGLSYDLMFYAFMNLYAPVLIFVNIIINAVFGGIVGGVVAWMLGYSKKPAAA